MGALDEAARSFQCERINVTISHKAHLEGMRVLVCAFLVRMFSKTRSAKQEDIYAWYAQSLDEETLSKELAVQEQRGEGLDQRVDTLSTEVSRMSHQLGSLVHSLRASQIVKE